MKTNYAFTINVSTKKFVNHRQWSKYSHDDQKSILNKIINNAIDKCPYIEHCEFYYELTKQNIFHVHGMFSTDFETVDKFQELIHNELGLPSVDPERVCFIKETQVDKTYWVNYMKKDQIENTKRNDVCLFRKV
jgi:hypothetical protein